VSQVEVSEMVPLPEILTKRSQSVTTPRKYRARYNSSHENYQWIVIQLEQNWEFIKPAVRGRRIDV